MSQEKWSTKIDMDSGYLPLANGWLYALPKTVLTGNERAIVDTIMLKTYGIHDPKSKRATKHKRRKEAASISLTYFASNLLVSKRSVCRMIRRLVGFKIIQVEPCRGPKASRYRLNPAPVSWDSAVWKVAPKPATNFSNGQAGNGDVCVTTSVAGEGNADSDVPVTTNGSAATLNGDAQVTLGDPSVGKARGDAPVTIDGDAGVTVAATDSDLDVTARVDARVTSRGDAGVTQQRKRERKKKERESKSPLPGSPLPTPDQLAQVWNDHCGRLPKVTGLSDERRRHCKARLSENGELNYWAGIVRILAESEFCNGNNDRGWRATFDFLLRPTTQFKAQEGTYSGRKQQAVGPPRRGIMLGREDGPIDPDNPF